MKKPAATPKPVATPKPFPTGLVVGGFVFLFILVFLGAFGYSFVKSKLGNLNQAAKTFTTLQKLAGGKLGDLPAGLDVKTKAEGLATCKQSGLEYCYPLVALSFDDLSVCKEAPDRQKCESGVLELKQQFEGGLEDGEDGETEETGDGDETGEVSDTELPDQELMECKKGAFSQSVAGKMEILGKEKVSFEGQAYETCCYETTEYSEGEVSRMNKTCMAVNGSDDTFVYDKVDGQYVLWGAVIKKGDEQCNYMYSDGKLESQTCF